MHVFVTGASGFIGTAVVDELIAHGHTVLGMTRSDEGAQALSAAGAQVYRAVLEDAAALTAGAAQAEGVIHLAFKHDFAHFKQNCEDDRAVIAALAAGLAGTDKPLLITSGAGLGVSKPGDVATEDTAPISSAVVPRAATEEAGALALADGVNVGVVRLPQVHDTKKQGLISYFVAASRAKGVCAYVGEGAGRWTAAHLSDTARLYRLALEQATPGARYHAVAEEALTARAIAEVLGRRLGLPVVSITPEEAPAHFGPMAMFAGMDSPASGALTRERLGWTPTGPGMIADLERAEFD